MHAQCLYAGEHCKQQRDQGQRHQPQRGRGREQEWKLMIGIY